jgi:hypothetical protein
MAIFHIVLGDEAVVFNSFLCEKVNGVGLLKKCIPDVFFIPENLIDVYNAPKSCDTKQGELRYNGSHGEA